MDSGQPLSITHVGYNFLFFLQVQLLRGSTDQSLREQQVSGDFLLKNGRIQSIIKAQLRSKNLNFSKNLIN